MSDNPRLRDITRRAAQRLADIAAPPPLPPAAQRYRDSLAEFFKASWHVLEPGTPLLWNWHLQVICDHVQALLESRLAKRNIIINVPPGTAKSRIVSVVAPAWMWIKNPSWRGMFSSGNPRVMTRDSINMRDLIESPWYRQTFGIRWKLAEDANTKLLYKNSAGGFRQALTAGQRTTGDRADGLFVDDPTDAADSNSVVALESAINWWDSAFGNRLNDLRTGSRCIIMQRLHENDLSGHLLRREPGQWEHLCLRMLYEIGQQPLTSLGNPDPRTTEGELMFPERFPQHIIDTERLRLGSAGFAGQMQQRPASLEGEIFKRGHFGRYNPSELSPFFERRCQVWDTAFKAKEESDFSVGFELAKAHDGAIFVLRRARGRFPYPELKSIITQWGTERPPHAVLIEDAASGQSVIQDLKATTRMPIVPVKPDGDKVARAHSIVPTYEAGVIYLPEGAPWVDEFLDEIHAFPKAAHDDQVDAFVYGIRWLMQARGGVAFGSVPRGDGRRW